MARVETTQLELRARQSTRSQVVYRARIRYGLQPTRLLCPWDFQGKSTGVGCHSLLCLFVLNQSKLFGFLIISFGTKNLLIPGNTSISLQADAPYNITLKFLMQLSAWTLRPKWRTPGRPSRNADLRVCQVNQVSQ